MKYKFLLLGIMITIVLVVSGCISNVTSTNNNAVNNSTGGTASAQGPYFTAMRDNATTVLIIYWDPNGATSVKGLYVKSPAISSPELFNSTTDVPEGQEITVTDPNLNGTVNGTVNLVLTSMVNNQSQVVLEGDV